MEDREIIKQNIEQYLEMVKTVDPELYNIKLDLLATRVNPKLLRRVIRALSILANSTGYGDINIHMKAGKTTFVRVQETETIEVETILDSE